MRSPSRWIAAAIGSALVLSSLSPSVASAPVEERVAVAPLRVTTNFGNDEPLQYSTAPRVETYWAASDQDEIGNYIGHGFAPTKLPITSAKFTVTTPSGVVVLDETSNDNPGDSFWNTTSAPRHWPVEFGIWTMSAQAFDSSNALIGQGNVRVRVRSAADVVTPRLKKIEILRFIKYQPEYPGIRQYYFKLTMFDPDETIRRSGLHLADDVARRVPRKYRKDCGRNGKVNIFPQYGERNSESRKGDFFTAIYVGQTCKLLGRRTISVVESIPIDGLLGAGYRPDFKRWATGTYTFSLNSFNN